MPDSPNTIFCYGCGNRMHAATLACLSCGAPQRGLPSARGGKSQTTAVVLAILLGGGGAHRFYLGSPGWGTLYLLFCWTFVPALFALLGLVPVVGWLWFLIKAGFVRGTDGPNRFGSDPVAQRQLPFGSVGASP